jgi:hypothetical protein
VLAHAPRQPGSWLTWDVSQESMTPAYNVVTSEIWRVLLPSDWKQKEASNDKSVYFEAPDETKGVYFISWRVDEAMSPKDRCDRDFQLLQRMEGSAWAIVNRWVREDGDLVVAGIDCLDEKKTYRIICQTMIQGGWAARFSFHDYACSNYEESRAWFKPFIESFAFNEEEG